MDKTEVDAITERIIGAVHKVSNTLGIGFVLNYLRTSELPAYLLINFSTPKAQIRRLHPSLSWKANSWKYVIR